MQHQLKTDKAVFHATKHGRKTYEIRFDDRGYTVDDTLILKETAYSGEMMKAGAELMYTGRELELIITHILEGPIYGLKKGWVILSTKLT